MPAISIIVPVYNVEEYVEKCIDSIIKQSFADFELILIDDGSTDSTHQICENFAKKDSRIRLHTITHSGLGFSRNVGLELVDNPEFITFIDGDDYIHPDYLKILHDSLTQNNCDISIINYKRAVITDKDDFFPFPEIKTRLVTQGEAMRRLFDEAPFMTAWGKLYRSNLIKGLRFINKYFGEDIEFNSKAYRLTQRICFSDYPLYRWIIRKNSITNSPYVYKDLAKIDNYYSAYRNLRDHELYASIAIVRINKEILSILHNVPESRKLIKENCKRKIKMSMRVLLANKCVGNKEKLMFLIFHKIPGTYALFRKFAAKYNR